MSKSNLFNRGTTMKRISFFSHISGVVYTPVQLYNISRVANFIKELFDGKYTQESRGHYTKELVQEVSVNTKATVMVATFRAPSREIDFCSTKLTTRPLSPTAISH